MSIIFYDPAGPKRHDYVTSMFFEPLKAWMIDHRRPFMVAPEIASVGGSTVIINADHLTHDVISGLRDNGNRIVGFSCTDSSYVSQCCRTADQMEKVDLFFILSGLQKVNEGHEVVMTPDFKLALEKRQFLPEEDWAVFDSMRKAGRLQSLPYVKWDKDPAVTPRPYADRSQKALIRGGHHMRRFLLCLELMKHDKLDVNSGFYTAPYFMDGMNPQFRYCQHCRDHHKRYGLYPRGLGGYQGLGGEIAGCSNPSARSLDVSDLGSWNNKCPDSFYKLAQKLGANIGQVEKLMNAQWLRGEDHLAMLSRITFTSDLKWLFSIYAAQRFWDAAMSGCINVLPSRTMEQEYFPAMNDEEHYLTYNETFEDLNFEFSVREAQYNQISGNALHLYNQWIKADRYALNSNLLQHIWKKIEEHCS